MAQPFLSQIEAFPFNFAPKGWALCAGQIMPINQNQALFSLLGTTFGGNGTTTFALPDLRGRLANGFGQGSGLANYTLGQRGGEETHTLSGTETPAHSHLVNAVKNGTTGGTSTPGGGVTLGEGYATEAGSPAQSPPFPRSIHSPIANSVAGETRSCAAEPPWRSPRSYRR